MNSKVLRISDTILHFYINYCRFSFNYDSCLMFFITWIFRLYLPYMAFYVSLFILISYIKIFCGILWCRNEKHNRNRPWCVGRSSCNQVGIIYHLKTHIYIKYNVSPFKTIPDCPFMVCFLYSFFNVFFFVYLLSVLLFA